MGAKTASPNELSKTLNITVGTIAYHMRVLERAEIVELVRTRPARGATEHFYRAKPDALIASRSWEELPPGLQGEAVADSLQMFMNRAKEALEAGAFQSREGAKFRWFPMAVDERGWQELERLLEEFTQRVLSVGERSKKRLGVRAGLAVILALALFPTQRTEPEEG
jgi:DNA-binding transcriptional ArsR family regulator